MGHPLHITGEPGEMADEAAQFAERLQKELGIEVKLLDERLTSWEAEQIVAQHKSPHRRKKSSIDDVAAAVLLREYLDRKRAHQQHVAAERE
jgi:putative Holliday junction resolvase